MSCSHLPILRKFNILLIEDNFSTLEAVQDMLDSSLLNIESAHSYAIARQRILDSRVRWHCWVLDIDLGGNDNGLNLMREFSHFPFIIILSGLKNMHLASEAVRLGAVDVFDKSPSTSLSSLTDTVFRTAVLGYLLNGKGSDHLPTFMALKNHVFSSVPDWAQHSCLSIRYLERICTIHFGLSPRHVLSLYYFLLSSIYLLENGNGLKEFRKLYDLNERTYFRHCAKFVIEHHASTYHFIRFSHELFRKIRHALRSVSVETKDTLLHAGKGG